MLELIAYSLVGVLVGVVTGVVPGLHPNTVIFTSLPFYLTTGIEFMTYAAVISGLSVSHTFHDFLPAIYLQAPEANTALSSMPGAEKAAEGEGPEAFRSTLLGGVTSALILAVFLPVLWLGLDSFYSLIEPFMAGLVLFFLLFLIFRDLSFPAVTTAVLSGLLGFITLNSVYGGSFVLMPMFSGLFAVPAVSRSLFSDFGLPEQDFDTCFKGVSGGLVGTGSGFIAGTVPGVGAAASTSFLSPLMDDSRESFLAGMGAVNTSDIIVSILAVFLIGKARSGASVVIQSLVRPLSYEVVLLAGVSFFSAGVSALLALRTEKVFVRAVDKIRFRYLAAAVLCIIAVFSYSLTGLYGLIVLFASSFIGFYSFERGCRGCCMAVLLVPTLLFLV